MRNRLQFLLLWVVLDSPAERCRLLGWGGGGSKSGLQLFFVMHVCLIKNISNYGAVN